MTEKELDLRGVPESVVDTLKATMLEIQKEKETSPSAEQQAAEEAEKLRLQQEADAKAEADRLAAEAAAAANGGEAADTRTPEEIAAAEAAAKAEEEKGDWREVLAKKQEEERKAKEAAEWEELKNDDLFKTLYNAKKSGAKMIDVIKTIQSTNVDDFTEDDLVAMAFKGESLDEHELAAKIEAFKEQPKLIKDAFLEKQREELRKSQTNILDNSAEIKKLKESYDVALTDLDVAAENLKGTLIGNQKITKALQAEIFHKASSFLPAFKSGNTYNAKAAFDSAVRDVMFSHIMNDVKTAAVSDAKKEVFKEIHNPDAKGTPLASGVAATKTDIQIQEDALKAHLEKQANPFGINKN